MRNCVFAIITSLFFMTGTAVCEDQYWGNIKHGSSHSVGNFEYYSDGTSSHRIGNTKFYSDGTSERTIGNYTFDSEGNTSTRIGDHTFRSDGNNGVDIGNFHHYDGNSINTIDGFKYNSGD